VHYSQSPSVESATFTPERASWPAIREVVDDFAAFEVFG
jgi:hypothetical protein